MFVPLPAHRTVVKLLAAYGLPHAHICKAVINEATRRPITPATLEKHFARELDESAAEMDAIVCSALTTQIKRGNIISIIWYMKNRMGWRDVVETQNRRAVDVNVKIAPEELSRKLKEFGLPSYVFGVDKPGPEPKLIDGNGLAQDDGDGELGNLPNAPTEPED
jgi:hypothetical protein